MKEILTELEIAASAERVWAVLTDFARWGEWNPFIPSMEGEARVGARVKFLAKPPGGMSATFRARIVTAEPGRELLWHGSLPVPGLFEGDHRFVLEALGPERVRLVHGEQLRGLLLPLMWGSIGEKTRRGFEAMNAALKARAEQRG